MSIENQRKLKAAHKRREMWEGLIGGLIFFLAMVAGGITNV